MEINTIWELTVDSLKKNIGTGVFNSWFSKIVPLTFENTLFVFCVPLELIKDRIVSKYYDELFYAIKSIDDSLQKIEIFVNKKICDEYEKNLNVNFSLPHLFKNEENLKNQTNLNEMANKEKSQFDLKEKTAKEKLDDNWQKNNESGSANNIFSIESFSALEKRYKFQNFIVGKTNEFAHAAATRVAESSETLFNPLFIYGGVGLGKTHLMHAIAWRINELNPKRRVIYLTAERFMYQFIKSLRFKDTIAFKSLFRSVDVLMVDDVQFISGKESTQEEFFHTFNSLMDDGKQIIISADKPPVELNNVEARLKSRLSCGLVADIHPTTYELRLGILQAKSIEMGLDLSHEILDFLATKITSNVRELEGALNRISAHMMLIGSSLTIDKMKNILRDLLKFNEKVLSIEDIQKRVSEFYGIKTRDLLSEKRLKSITKPRQIAMHICKELTQFSLIEIGKDFGGRGHATVIHALKKVEEMISLEETTKNEIEIIIKSLSH